MAESVTPRFGFAKQSAGTDAWPGRVGFMAILDKIEGNAAMFASGTFAARPAAGKEGRIYRATDTGVVYYDTGAAWLTLTPPSSYGLAYGPSASNNPINEVGWQPAGAEIAYCYALSPNQAGFPSPPTNLPSWLSVQTNPANPHPGKLTLTKGARYLVDVSVKFEDLDATDGLWALGYTTSEDAGGIYWSPGERPGWVLPPHKHTAEMAGILGTSNTALTLQCSASVGSLASAGGDIEFLPVVYLAPSSDPDTGGSSQRQIQAVRIDITRFPL